MGGYPSSRFLTRQGGSKRREKSMGNPQDYIAKCLAGCPEGQEELLLGELARHLMKRFKPDQPIVLRDDSGLFAYLIPAATEASYPLSEESPEYAAEIRRRMNANEPPVSAETFFSLLRAEDPRQV
jgi:hypothetical protein